ncbi:MAG: beta-hydroxyacyl-ACP dehydratase [Desulforhopalus sp.]|nr:beta-hydroxyacyl-ACP dehydratase [Desulforhopalus sp.]
MKPEIEDLIPHRPPFLWVDRVVSFSDDCIHTEKYFPPDLECFRGHYPGNPIMPGVLLCEAIFQSGALLMSKRNPVNEPRTNQIPILTRIGGAKFKKPVLPGDTAQIKVTLNEIMSAAFFFQGTLKVDNKVAVSVDFVCAMVTSSP